MKTIAITVLALALSGCATGYQSKGMSGGFSETVLAPDTFMIDFSGNGFTSAERASDFAILRAADKSEALGCDHFSVLNGREDATTSTVSFGTANVGQNTVVASGGAFPVVKPNTKLYVKCFKGLPAGGEAFDVKFIQNSIRAKYKIKPPTNG